jgi:AbrB family looped-hinge helix DNA binding protein
MRITSKGQVTIPAEIREKAGLLPHAEVEFEFDGRVVRIVRAKNKKKKKRTVAGLASSLICGEPVTCR